MDKLKYIKLENEDGSYTDSIPLAVDSDHVDVNGSTLTNELNNKANISNINNLQNQINGLASGSPLVASSTSGMTDTTRIYVNTTDGNWYYYNGSSWVIGGRYQSTGIANQSIDYLKLNQMLEDTLKCDYTPINMGNITYGELVTITNNNIEKVTNNSFGYYKIQLQANNIYLLSSLRIITDAKKTYGYILVDDNDNIIEYAPLPNENTFDFNIIKPTQNCYCYLQVRQNLANVQWINLILENTFIYKLSNLESLYTDYDNVFLKNLTNDIFENKNIAYLVAGSNYLGVNVFNTYETTSRWKLHKFPMFKNLTYKLKSINYQKIVGIVITNYAGIPIYQSANAQSPSLEITEYNFKAPINGYIYICEDTQDETHYKASYYVPYNTEIINVNDKFANKIISCIGDSIVEGANNNGGYPASLQNLLPNTLIVNKGVSGSTIAFNTGRRSIAQHYNDIKPNSNIVTIGGGWNDWALATPLGTLTTTYTDEINTDTFIGALEYLFRNLINNYPNCRFIYITTHNVRNDYNNPNANNNTYTDFINATINTCKKYGIPYVDLYHQSQLNTGIDILKQFTNNNDGLHPTKEGYNKFYTPYIMERLKTLII